MKRFLYPFIIGLFFLAIQASLLNHYPYGVKPNFILIEIVFISLYRNPVQGVLISTGLGYLVDLLSGFFIGLNSFLGVIIFSFVKLFEGRFIISNYILKIFLVSISTLIYLVGWVVILYLLYPHFVNRIYPIYFILQIIVNAIFTYPAWIILEKIEEFNAKKVSNV